MYAGSFQLPLPTLPSSSEPRPFRSEGTSRLDVEVQAISSTLRSVYAWEADVCYPLVHGIWNLATLWLRKAVGNRCIQLRYTGVQAQCLHMLFPQPIPATNIRMLAATPTVRQDVRGFCPDLSSHWEAGLEVSSQQASFLSHEKVAGF